jgi:GTP-binding protein HflX
LKAQIELVRSQRDRYRERRRRSGRPVVALVGYTNAGKSTLLNALAHSDVYTADQWFATLDPTTRRVKLPNGQEILFTDTVGFIQKLPASIIAAFRATLEEIQEADLLLHVIDINHPNASEQAQVVHQTLKSLSLDAIPLLTVLNKADRLLQPIPQWEHTPFAQTVLISAQTGIGLELLLSHIQEKIFQSYEPITVLIPHDEGKLVNAFHEEGIVDRLTHQERGTLISGRIPLRKLADFLPYKSSPRARKKKADD